MIIKKDETEIKTMPIEQEIQHIIEMINKICKRNNINYLLLWDKYSLTGQAFEAIYKNNSTSFLAPLIVYNKETNLFENLKNFEIIGNEINYYFTNEKIATIDTNTTEENLKKGNNINGNIKVFIDYTNKYIEQILSFYNISYSQTLEELEFSKILRDYVVLNKEDFNNKYLKEQIVNLLTVIKKQVSNNFTIYNSITHSYIKGIKNNI